MSLPFLYFSPVNYALAYPWPQRPGTVKMGRSWANDPWGDDLLTCIQPFTIDEIIELLSTMAETWRKATETYRQALAGCLGEQGAMPDAAEDSNHEVHALEELMSAEYCGLCFASACDLFRWYRGVLAGKPDMALIEPELARCRQVLPLLEAWPDLGFHQECQHRMCSPDLVRDKIEKLGATMVTSATAGGR